MSELISQAEFAKRLGVSQATVSRSIGRGRITKTPSGKLDWETQSVAWETNRRIEKDHQSRGVGAGEGQAKSSDYQLVLIANKKMEFKLKELKFREQEGELISKENFNKRYLPGISILKNHVMALAARHSHNLAALLIRHAGGLSKAKSYHKNLAKIDPQQLARDIAEILDSDMRAIMKEISGAEYN